MKKTDEIQKVNQYNAKIDKKFIQYLLTEKSFPNSELKEMGTEYKTLFNAYIKFVHEDLSEASIGKMIEALGSAEFHLSQAFIEEGQRLSKKAKPSQIIKFFVYIVESDMFVDRAAEMAKILMNKLLINNGYCPIIFYPNVTNSLLEHIKMKSYDEDLDRFFYHLLTKIMDKFNIKHVFKTQVEVIELILEYADVLKRMYHVEALGIYGSFLINRQTEYSDLDIWIQVRGQEKGLKASIIEFLSMILDIQVDCKLLKINTKHPVIQNSMKVF